MKSVSKQICVLLLSSAAVFTGCTKKPMRPDPNSTVLGPTGGGSGALTPEAVPTSPDAGLQARDNGNFDESGQDRKSLEAQAVFYDFDRANIRASERPKLRRPRTIWTRTRRSTSSSRGIATGAERPNTTSASATAAQTRPRSTSSAWA